MKDKFDPQFYKEILNGINSNVYITDIETDEIVYMNDYMKQTFQIENPEGHICWKTVQKNMTERCEFCKIKSLEEGKDKEPCIWKEENTFNGRTYLNYDRLERIGDRTFFVQNAIDITDYVQLSVEATIDELTGLPNRNAGKKHMEEILENMKEDEFFCIALCDINDLKWVNDTYGHIEGDHLISFVARNIQKELSDAQFVFRLSGDEFILIFMNQDIQEAEQWLENTLMILDSSRVRAGISYDVSFSYGLALVQGYQKLTVSDVLALADTQMYIRKREYHLNQEKQKNSRRIEQGKERLAFQYNKEALFEVLSESVEDYVFAGNLKTGIFIYSYKMMADFGLPSQIIKDAAVFWSKKIHPNDAEMFLKSNQEIAEGKTDRHTIIYRAKNTKGEWIHLLCHGRMVRDSEGNPDLFGGIIRNLDRREKTINEELRIISDSSTDGIFKVALASGIPVLYANDGCYDIHGYTRKQFAEQWNNHAANLIYEEDLERVGEEIKRGLHSNHRRIVLEYRIKKRDGKIGWVHVNAGARYLNDESIVLIGIIMDITERKELEERLTRTEQLFRVARKTLGLSIWEYDIPRKRIIQTESSRDVHGWEDVLENVPDSLIERGYVHPDDVYMVRKLYQAIEEGEPTVSVVVRTRHKNSESYWWEKKTYTVMQWQENRPIWAVGMSEDVTTQKEAEIRVFEEEKKRKRQEQDLVFYFRINMDRDVAEEVWSMAAEEKVYHKNDKDRIGYTKVYEMLLDSIANEDDRKRFQSYYEPDQIRAAVQEGAVFSDFEFRQKQKNGLIIWAVLNSQVSVSPESGDKILFGYVKNIDMIKRKELSLYQKAEMDRVSGFYRFSTAKLMIENSLEKADTESCILILLDVDNFHKINQEHGFLTGDKLLHKISKEINKRLPTSCIKSRLNGDLFLIFQSGIVSPSQKRREVEEIRKSLCGVYQVKEKEFDITVSVGMVLCFSGEMTYAKMYQCAFRALKEAKRNGKNQSFAYRNLKENSMRYKDMLPLMEECWNQIDRGGSIAAVQELLLNYVGGILDAHRVLLYGEEDDRRLHLEQIWEGSFATDKESGGEGLLVEKLEEAARAYYPEKWILISDKSSPAYQQAAAFYGNQEVPLPLVVASSYKKQETSSMMVIERAYWNEEVSDTLELLIEFLHKMSYIYELHKNYEYVVGHDSKTGLLNYDRYMRYLREANEDACSSFGIVQLRVIDLKKYNIEYGIKMGDELLRFTAKVLVEIFGKERAFRVSGARFVVFCPNITYENFLYRYQEMEERLENSYLGIFSAARAWGQHALSVENLLTQSEEKLTIALTKVQSVNTDNNQTMMEIKRKLRKELNSGYFYAYLQPKAFTKTGQICGAEALIRYQKPGEAIVTPGHFLPPIERAGLVRYIDLFILRDVCRMISQWLEEGWNGYPISLNFSRSTILEPGILEEVNQIVESSKIPKELLEIEVTESISSTDSRGLTEIVNQFVQEGYKIALDDFGAEYSNIYVLYSLKLNSLKLDRRIISDIYYDNRARIVVENVIDMCKKLGIVCVAEGVETEEHLGVLKEMGCDVIQGYYLNKPLPEEEFKRLYIIEEK